MESLVFLGSHQTNAVLLPILFRGCGFRGRSFTSVDVLSIIRLSVHNGVGGSGGGIVGGERLVTADADDFGTILFGEVSQSPSISKSGTECLSDIDLGHVHILRLGVVGVARAYADVISLPGFRSDREYRHTNKETLPGCSVEACANSVFVDELKRARGELLPLGLLEGTRGFASGDHGRTISFAGRGSHVLGNDCEKGDGACKGKRRQRDARKRVGSGLPMEQLEQQGVSKGSIGIEVVLNKP